MFYSNPEVRLCLRLTAGHQLVRLAVNQFNPAALAQHATAQIHDQAVGTVHQPHITQLRHLPAARLAETHQANHTLGIIPHAQQIMPTVPIGQDK
jgi:hypothetical protein